MKALFIILGVAAVLAVLFLTGAYICFRMAFSVPRKETLDPLRILTGEQYDPLADEMTSLIKGALALPYEEVRTVSRDGLSLYGRYYEISKDAPVQIMFHGYRSNAQRDFSGGVNLALENGNNVLLVDQRAHGKSEGSFLTFGVREREDCLVWIDYVLNRNGADTKIFLVGISMGAATVLMASELKLPANVKGIIADCPYSSPKEIIQKVIGEMKVPVKAGYFFVALGARIYGHFSPEDCCARDAVKHTKTPILLIHGEDDRFVPCEMSR